MKVPGFIARDFWRKLAALFFAVIIYLNVDAYLHNNKTISGVPVEVRPTQELIMTSPRQFSASVVVSGVARELNELDVRSISGKISVTPADRQPDGSYRVRLTSDNFRQSGGVKVVEVNDPEITLHLQRRISREVPVAMRFSGTLPGAFRISDRTCIPPTVTVNGPENAVAALKDVTTESIPLSDRESSFEYEVKLMPPASIRAIPDKVTVQIGIERNIVQHNIPALPVGLFCDSGSGTVAGFIPGISPVAAVSLSGTPQLIAALRPDDVRLYIDVSNISTPGFYTLPVRCHIRREGIEVRSVVPAEFKVSISKSPIKK